MPAGHPGDDLAGLGRSILLLVDQTGVACHTGQRSCFFTAFRNGARTVIADVEISPDELYKS